MAPRRGEAWAGERRAIIDEITRALGDDVPPDSYAWWQYVVVVTELGDARARELVREVHAVEAAGGMATQDGSRRRTPGGVFFVLAYEHLGAKRARSARWHATHLFQEAMLRRFLRLLALALPASPERPAKSDEAAAQASAPVPPAPAAATPDAPASRPARRPEPADVEVLVMRRRPATKPGPSTPRAGR